MDKLRRLARQLRNESTDAERALWTCLRSWQMEGFRFRRQVPIAGYIAHFVCPQAKLIVEVDGGQHSEQVAYDASRTGAMQALGFTVLRYWNHDVLLKTDDVAADIYRELTKSFTPPQPSPSLRERKGAEAPTVEAKAESKAKAKEEAKEEAKAKEEARVEATADAESGTRTEPVGIETLMSVPSAARTDGGGFAPSLSPRAKGVKRSDRAPWRADR